MTDPLHLPAVLSPSMQDYRHDLSQDWRTLARHARRLGKKTLRQLFAEVPDRFTHLSVRCDDLLLDFSRERLDILALQSLLALAQAAGVATQRALLFAGAAINNTESRSVLHMALRGSVADSVVVDGESVAAQVRREQSRFLRFAEQLRAGVLTSADGAVFSDIVHIGIGGCHLGPVMTTRALAHWHDGPNIHFISNIDGAYLIDILPTLNPNTTLVIVSSKSFTTFETLYNFTTVFNWLKQALGNTAYQQIVAITSNTEAALAKGFPAVRIFTFWQWVGGRYAIWSAVGLVLAIAIGSDRFRQFLAGAKHIDAHFIDAPFAVNLPVLMGVISVWRRNLLGYQTNAIIPYDGRLTGFPPYMQQLEMESNGKRVGRDGAVLTRSSAPIIWGGSGTDAQHSFFQCIHQGSDIVPVDFLVAAKPLATANARLSSHHDALLCNAIAQAQVLAFGRNEAEIQQYMDSRAQDQETLIPHCVLPGNRPSSLLVYKQLDPATLGKLIALFEHKVFVAGVIWGINSYDQWSVEWNKYVARDLFNNFTAQSQAAIYGDTATELLSYLRHLRRDGQEDGIA